MLHSTTVAVGYIRFLHLLTCRVGDDLYML